METSRPFWRDESFLSMCESQPALAGMRPHMPPALAAFDGRDRIRHLRSSYGKCEYEFLFYALVRALEPQRCVELGVLEGFSLLATAAALRDNRLGHVHAYDLFEAYRYKHGNRRSVLERCTEEGVEEHVTVVQADAAAARRAHAEIDMLHVDLSNDGDVFREQFAFWADRVTTVMLLEGGSRERDRVDWMRLYRKEPIARAIEDLRARFPEWTLAVLAPFPSVTLALRR